MNTQYSEGIRTAKEQFDHRVLLANTGLTKHEQDLAYGRHVRGAVYIALLGNAVIYGLRKNLMNNRNFTIFAFIGTYPIAVYLSQYLFGYDKLRRIDQVAEHTKKSADIYDSYMAQLKK